MTSNPRIIPPPFRQPSLSGYGTLKIYTGSRLVHHGTKTDFSSAPPQAPNTKTSNWVTKAKFKWQEVNNPSEEIDISQASRVCDSSIDPSASPFDGEMCVVVENVPQSLKDSVEEGDKVYFGDVMGGQEPELTVVDSDGKVKEVFTVPPQNYVDSLLAEAMSLAKEGNTEALDWIDKAEEYVKNYNENHGEEIEIEIDIDKNLVKEILTTGREAAFQRADEASSNGVDGFNETWDYLIAAEDFDEVATGKQRGIRFNARAGKILDKAAQNAAKLGNSRDAADALSAWSNYYDGVNLDNKHAEKILWDSFANASRNDDLENMEMALGSMTFYSGELSKAKKNKVAEVFVSTARRVAEEGDVGGAHRGIECALSYNNNIPSMIDAANLMIDASWNALKNSTNNTHSIFSDKEALRRAEFIFSMAIESAIYADWNIPKINLNELSFLSYVKKDTMDSRFQAPKLPPHVWGLKYAEAYADKIPGLRDQGKVQKRIDVVRELNGQMISFRQEALYRDPEALVFYELIKSYTDNSEYNLPLDPEWGRDLLKMVVKEEPKEKNKRSSVFD